MVNSLTLVEMAQNEAGEKEIERIRRRKGRSSRMRRIILTQCRIRTEATYILEIL